MPTLKKRCSCCGKQITIVRQSTGAYEGGYFFGKIPLCTKREIKSAVQNGFRTVQFVDRKFHVLKVDPKSYGSTEYWECKECYDYYST